MPPESPSVPDVMPIAPSSEAVPSDASEAATVVFPPLDLRPKSLAAHVGRGFLMGGADIIPGVSGGTVALILGIYTRLITAIGRVGPEWVGELLGREFRQASRRIDAAFVAPLGVGILLGAATLGSVVDVLLEDYRQPTLSVFFGLIAASAVFVAKLVPRWSPRAYAAVAAGAVVAFVLVGLPVLHDPPEGLWYLFVCGMIGICAMILPGVSGAFLLLVLGSYERITGLIKRFVKLDVGLEDVLTLATFAAGCLVGLLSFARLLSRLLKRFPSVTLAGLCGLMIGSLRKLWPFQMPSPDSTPDHPLFVNRPLGSVAIDGDFWMSVVLFGVGFLLVFLMERFAPDDDASEV